MQCGGRWLILKGSRQKPSFMRLITELKCVWNTNVAKQRASKRKEPFAYHQDTSTLRYLKLLYSCILTYHGRREVSRYAAHAYRTRTLFPLACRCAKTLC